MHEYNYSPYRVIILLYEYNLLIPARSGRLAQRYPSAYSHGLEEKYGLNEDNKFSLLK